MVEVYVKNMTEEEDQLVFFSWTRYMGAYGPLLLAPPEGLRALWVP